MTVRRSLLVAGGALLVIGLIVALAGGFGSPGDSSKDGRSERVQRLSLTTLEGERVELPRGRPGALFFTTSNCHSCVPSAQALGELKSEMGESMDAVWIGLDPIDRPDEVRELRRSIGSPPYPFAIDSSGKLASRYAIQALGTTIVYDADAKVVARLVEPSKEQLRAALKEAGVSMVLV